MYKAFLLISLFFISSLSKAQTYEEMDVLYQHLSRSDQFGKVIWAIGDACSDDSEVGGLNSQMEPLLQKWAKFTHDQCDSYLYGFWHTSYTAINLCNRIIAMDTVSIQRKGEARFIRALQYYYLVNIFNNIPIFTEEFDPDFNQQAFAQKNEVLAVIESDLLESVKLLPDSYSAGNKYRATKGAALTLLTKVALLNEDYAGVFDYSRQIINSGLYSLESNFADNFSSTNKHGIESIFEIEQFDVSSGGSLYANDGRNYHNFMQSPKGLKFNCPTANLKNEFEAGDQRLAATIFQNGDSGGDTLTIYTSDSPTGFYARKYYMTASMHNGDRFIPNNIKVFRYADVLLMAAEASCYMGNIGEAAQYVNMLRVRAGLDPLAVTSVDSALEAIRHERRVELALEGHRFFDLQRYAKKGIIDLRETLLASGVAGADNFQTGINEVFPIPYHVLYTNSYAMQNPGYGYFECVSIDNPYKELTVSANIQTSMFDIENVFCDSPKVTGNTNSNLLYATSLDSSLFVAYTDGQLGEATITITGQCGIYPVQETIHIRVVQTEPVAENNVTVNETAEKTTSFSVSTTVFDNKGLGSGVKYTASLADGSPLPDWIVFDPGTLTFIINENASQAAFVSRSILKSGSAITSLDLLIVATDDNGTTAAMEYTAEIKGAPTSVINAKGTAEVFIYPNPNNGEFKINTGGVEGSLRLFSISGRLVYENDNVSSGESISLVNLPKNIYLYQFKSQGVTIHGKILIK